MRAAYNAIWSELKRAAEELGFDSNNQHWMKLRNEESSDCPHTMDGDDAPCLALLPPRGRPIRCLELVGYLDDSAV